MSPPSIANYPTNIRNRIPHHNSCDSYPPFRPRVTRSASARVTSPPHFVTSPPFFHHRVTAVVASPTEQPPRPRRDIAPMPELPTLTDQQRGWRITDPILRLRDLATGRLYPLPDPRTHGGSLLGAAAGPQQLHDPTGRLSRQHAHLAWNGARWLLRDLDSKNGLWIDGVRRREAELAPGLELGLGGLVLLVESADLTPPPRARRAADWLGRRPPARRRPRARQSPPRRAPARLAPPVRRGRPHPDRAPAPPRDPRRAPPVRRLRPRRPRAAPGRPRRRRHALPLRGRAPRRSRRRARRPARHLLARAARHLRARRRPRLADRGAPRPHRLDRAAAARRARRRARAPPRRGRRRRHRRARAAPRAAPPR